MFLSPGFPVVFCCCRNVRRKRTKRTKSWGDPLSCGGISAYKERVGFFERTQGLGSPYSRPACRPQSFLKFDIFGSF
jgi:hypothetical protein